MSGNRSASERDAERTRRLLPQVHRVVANFVQRLEAGELPEVSSDPTQLARLLGLAAELDAHARRRALDLARALSDEEIREIGEIRRRHFPESVL